MRQCPRDGMDCFREYCESQPDGLPGCLEEVIQHEVQSRTHELQQQLEQSRKSLLAMREVCAQIAEKEPTWVTSDSYAAQVDMRQRIAKAIREFKFVQSGNLVSEEIHLP